MSSYYVLSVHLIIQAYFSMPSKRFGKPMGDTVSEVYPVLGMALLRPFQVDLRPFLAQNGQHAETQSVCYGCHSVNSVVFPDSVLHRKVDPREALKIELEYYHMSLDFLFDFGFYSKRIFEPVRMSAYVIRGMSLGLGRMITFGSRVLSVGDPSRRV